MVSTWGFIVPMVWGFSARWLPVFLGFAAIAEFVRASRPGFQYPGCHSRLLEQFFTACILFLAGAATAVVAIRFFESAVKPAKTVNIHRSFPVFIRIAYVWLLIAVLSAFGPRRLVRHPGFGVLRGTL